MLINISDNYYLRSDSRCLILSEKKISGSGKEYYNDLGFYRSLGEVVNACMRHKIYMSEATVLIELVDELTEFMGRVNGLCEGITVEKLRAMDLEAKVGGLNEKEREY